MKVDDYVHALEFELRDQPRRVRRTEAADLREHLEELPAGALEQLEAPDVYAHEYRTQRNLPRRRVRGAWRGISRAGRIVIVAFVIALVAAMAIPPWIAHYQPVSVSVYFGGPNTVPSHEEHGDTVYSYREGGIIRLGMDFRNSGRFDATISGLADEGELGPLELAGVGIVSPPGCCSSEAAHPARFPIRVPARSVRTVVLTLRMSTCRFGASGRTDAGSSAGIVQLFFSMKSLGVHHKIVVPLARFWIDFPNHLQPCPSKPSP